MSEQKQPTLLLSTPRSGSNLLRSILDEHPEVAAPPPFETALPHEFPELEGKSREKFVRDILIWQKYSPHRLFSDLDSTDICERMDDWSFYELQRGIYDAYADENDASRWMTKYNGGNTFSRVSGAVDYYDDLKIVYLVRDARDVVLSFKSSIPGPFHSYFGARHWSDEQAEGIDLLDGFEERVHLIHYEDLLQNPNREIRDVCDFLGITARDGMLAYHERDETIERAKVHHFENLSKPIQSDNYEKFRDQLPEDEVKIVEKIAEDELTFFDYDTVYSESELESVSLEDEGYYVEENRTLAKEFDRDMWRNDPREMVDLRLGQRFKFFLQLRYLGL